MKRSVTLAAVIIAALLLVLPFFGGNGLSPLSSPATSALGGYLPGQPGAVVTVPQPTEAWSNLFHRTAVTVSGPASIASGATTGLTELGAQNPSPVTVTAPGKASKAGSAETRRAGLVAAGGSCPGAIDGAASGAPGAISAGGVAGTSNDDLVAFADQYNTVRVANCLQPVPFANFRYDSCMEKRLFWIAEDPSTDPASAWGHTGTVRSDGVPAVGCDGNLAGGSDMGGAGAAARWWNSISHRASLYKPTNTSSMSGVCIYFAMTHGDGNLGAEAYSFSRAAAKWGVC